MSTCLILDLHLVSFMDLTGQTTGLYGINLFETSTEHKYLAMSIFIIKYYYRRPNPKKNMVYGTLCRTLTLRPLRVDSNTFTIGIGQLYARVDSYTFTWAVGNPVPESTLS